MEILAIKRWAGTKFELSGSKTMFEIKEMTQIEDLKNPAGPRFVAFAARSEAI